MPTLYSHASQSKLGEDRDDQATNGKSWQARKRRPSQSGAEANTATTPAVSQLPSLLNGLGPENGSTIVGRYIFLHRLPIKMIPHRHSHKPV